MRFWIHAFVAAFISLHTGFAFAAEPSVKLERNADGKPIAFQATGLADSVIAALKANVHEERDYASVLSVSVVTGGTVNAAMLGKYEQDGQAIRFIPRFPLRPGLSYRATVSAGAGKPLVFTFDIPEVAAAAAEVKEVYPSGPSLPVNHLRFYLHFSQPMSRGEAYEHLRLLKADGSKVDLPFLELGEELWDAEGKRLTVLIDPGRIKKGVTPRDQVGTVFEEGATMTLVVDAGWKDGEDRPLAREFRKSYKIGPAVETAIDPAAWKVSPPPAGSREALEVRFPRALDHALLNRLLSVADAEGRALPGKATVDEQERRWRFVPEADWPASACQVLVDTTLEDTCGNRIGRAFELDQFRPVTRKVVPEAIRIMFTPQPTRPSPPPQ